MKYIVRASLTVSAWTEVEADSKAEAIEIAEQREVAGLSHNALYPDDTEAWHFENDGEPYDIGVEAE